MKKPSFPNKTGSTSNRNHSYMDKSLIIRFSIVIQGIYSKTWSQHSAKPAKPRAKLCVVRVGKSGVTRCFVFKKTKNCNHSCVTNAPFPKFWLKNNREIPVNIQACSWKDFLKCTFSLF